MASILVVLFIVAVISLMVWAVVILPRHQDEPLSTTLSRPAKGGRDSKCPHVRYTPVDVNGIVVGHLCLDCDEQLGPVVTRDPDGYVYFSDY